jgi:signal transduction histidine kinase
MSQDRLFPVEPADLEETPRLEHLVDRKGLAELVGSLAQMSGVSIRLFNTEGTLLADGSLDSPLLRRLEGVPAARAALSREIVQIKRIDPAGRAERCSSLTGAFYQVIAVDYDHRRMGRAIVGPFLEHPPSQVPPGLAALDPDLPLDLLASLPLLPPERVASLEAHLRSSLDLILFAGHKSLLTSQMHLASISANYRELQDRNARLQQAYDRLRELDRLKSNFLATVSHELRTPLTSIIGYSEMLTEGIAGSLTEEQHEFIQTIHEKGEQLLQLIKNLLDLTKLESGTLSVQRAPTPIEPVLRQVVSTFLPAARKKGVVLELILPPDLPPVLGDGERLRQVFLNLTENALKFTPVSGLIRLSATLVSAEDPEDDDGFALLAPSAEQLEVRVADSGIGIPEAERSKVFDAFYQVDSSSTREVGGTGLGLSIVKRIVDAHEGSVCIEANQPRGAVFVVRLPLASP